MSLDNFLQLIFNVYEAYTAALFVQEGDALSCLAAMTFAKSFDKARRLSLDGTLPGWAVKHREPLIIGNFDKDEETLGYYSKDEEIKSFMAYPLDPAGVIVIDSRKKWVFTDKEKKLLGHFVTILAKEVEREERLREMEEDREQLTLTRRMIHFVGGPHADGPVVEEILKEGMTAAGADLALAGIEESDVFRIIAAHGDCDPSIVGAECPARATIAAMVVEGAKELLLPYESGFLKKKPFLFQNDVIRTRQYFGFPLFVGERPFGFLGFLSLSSTRLREGAIPLLRDMSMLLSLHLARLAFQSEIRDRIDRDPITGAWGFKSFVQRVEEMTGQKLSFTLISIKLPDFQSYNRSIGVERADGMLRKIYQALAYCIGKSAVITRSGGSRFYAAVKGENAFEGQNVPKILQLTITADGAGQGIIARKAIEIGAASFPKDGQDIWTLLRAAEDRGRQNVI
jgi:GGDEF domain-containing protein